jgi:hypothetical protein
LRETGGVDLEKDHLGLVDIVAISVSNADIAHLNVGVFRSHDTVLNREQGNRTTRDKLSRVLDC